MQVAVFLAQISHTYILDMSSILSVDCVHLEVPQASKLNIPKTKTLLFLNLALG